MTDYEACFWNAERLVRAAKSPDLEHGAALLGAREVLRRLEHNAAQISIEGDFLQPGPFAHRATETLEAALREVRPDLRRVMNLLERRFQEHCAALSASLPEPAAVIKAAVPPSARANPYSAVALRRSIEERCRSVTQRGAENIHRLQDEASGVLSDVNARLSAAEHQIANYLRGSQASSQSRTDLSEWRLPATVSLIGSLLAWVLGLSVTVTLMAGLVCGGAMYAWQRFTAKHRSRVPAQQIPPGLSRLSAELMRPVGDLLIQYYQLAERTAIANLESSHTAAVLSALPPAVNSDVAAVERQLDCWWQRAKGPVWQPHLGPRCHWLMAARAPAVSI